MSQEQADANDKGGSADAFREAQVGATFMLLKYALRGTEALADHFEVDLSGLTENCMEDEILCTSYEQWIKTRMSTTMFTPGWMLVFALGSQIMMTRNANSTKAYHETPGMPDPTGHCPEQPESYDGMSNTEPYFVPLDGDGGNLTPLYNTEDSPPITPHQPTYEFSDDPEERARIDALIVDALRPSISKARASTTNPPAIRKAPRKPRTRRTPGVRKRASKKKPSVGDFLDLMKLNKH